VSPSRFTDAPAHELAVVSTKPISCSTCEAMGYRGADTYVALYDVLENGTWRFQRTLKCRHSNEAELEALAIMGRTPQEGFPGLYDPLWQHYYAVMKARMKGGGLVSEVVRRLPLYGPEPETSPAAPAPEGLPAQAEVGNEPDTGAPDFDEPQAASAA